MFLAAIKSFLFYHENSKRKLRGPDSRQLHEVTSYGPLVLLLLPPPHHATTTTTTTTTTTALLLLFTSLLLLPTIITAYERQNIANIL
jgi:hypothetical protein